MARILLGVSGGIAAYKACEVCRLFVKGGHEVVPLVTPGAERFVTAETFRALARRPTGDDVYLHLTRADLLVVAPCTANTLAKLAHGLADNVLTEAALAHRGPVLVAPAMNPRMWAHPATRANAEALRSRGVVLVGPDEGETAEGLAAKRPTDTAAWTLELEPTTDVLSTLGEQRRPGQLLVGFAAESGDAGLERAREKLARKGADLFVLNDVSRPDIGFDSSDNELTLLAASAERAVAKAPKEEIATVILDDVAALI